MNTDRMTELLDKISFPLCHSRTNVTTEANQSFVLGDVNYRGQASVGYRTRGPSKYNKKYPELFKAIKTFCKEYLPNDFSFTTIQVNKNVQCKPHFDKNNVGSSCIIGLGDYTGGELVIEGKDYDIQNKILQFDGKKGHWVKPFRGTRYSIILFTHSFMPPNASTRNYEVTRYGMYNNGVRIVKYTKNGGVEVQSVRGS